MTQRGKMLRFQMKISEFVDLHTRTFKLYPHIADYVLPFPLLYMSCAYLSNNNTCRRYIEPKNNTVTVGEKFFDDITVLHPISFTVKYLLFCSINHKHAASISVSLGTMMS